MTQRPFVLGGHCFANLKPVPCSPAEGVALVSQFLRARGVFPADATEEQGITLRFDQGMFFWVATRALLPEGWRWLTHCVEADASDPNSDLTSLAQSAFQRISRTLMTRDALRWNLTLPHNNTIADDTMADVDHALAYLVGAFDAVARVAHRALGITGGKHDAAWQKTRWRDRVGAAAPGLAAVMEPGSANSDLFEAIRLMRNTT